MPFKISTDLSYILIRFSGEVTIDDFKNALADLRIIENENSFSSNQLADVRNVTSFNINFDQIRSVEINRQKTIFHNNFKTAFLAFNEEELTFIHFLKTINNNPQISREVFTSRIEAEEWLYNSK